MGIPQFNTEGTLPKGIHICSGQEFIDRFCSDVERKQFIKPVEDILDFAKQRGVVKIFVGGSFVMNASDPNDIDCVLVFNEDRYIPSRTERVSIAGLKFDILYASMECEYVIDYYLKLFSTGRYGMRNIGVIQIDLYDQNEVWKIRHEPDENTFEIIKRAYNDRSLIDINEKNGILVTVHGLLSRAKWNMEIAPVASNQGWVVAPFIYDIDSPLLLIDEGLRNKVVNEFREWIYDIQQRFDGGIAIIAHSFGSYIIGAYLNGFKEDEFPPVSFNSVILTGSILNAEFDWEKYRGSAVYSVYNAIAPNDEWVKYMPKGNLAKWLNMDPLFGRSGTEGFASKTPMLIQSTNGIFRHGNVIKRDIIETKWMPFLNANKGIIHWESIDLLKRQIADESNKDTDV